jgi:hypothetical protein
VKYRRLSRLFAALVVLAMLILPAVPVLAAGTISISKTYASPGETLTATFSGFTVGAHSYTITLDGASIGTSGTGSFATASATKNFTISADAAADTYTLVIHVTGADDVTRTYTNFVVYQQPHITLNDGDGYVGDSITITGTQFTPSSTATIFFGTATWGTVTVPASGNFTKYLTIPAAANGDHTIKVTDYSGYDSNSATYTVYEKITISAATGAVGSTTIVTGTGFAASTTVSFYFNDVATGGTATTDATGGFTYSLTIPPVSSGSHIIRAQDSAGNSDSKTYTISQKISVSPASGNVGAAVTVSGSGYSPGSVVTFLFDDVNVGAPATVTSAGSFSTSLTIPAAYGGIHHILAYDSGGGSSSATFSVISKVVMSPASGITGTAVTVTGTGMEASAPVIIKYNGNIVVTTPTSVTTNATGGFSATFNVPSGLAGTFPVEISDGTTTATTNFTSTTDATISQTTSETSPGHVGMSLIITGQGFKPNASVSVSYASAPVTLATVSTDASGNFTANITIPASTHGLHTIIVTDTVITKQFAFFMESAPPAIPQPLLPLMGDKAKSLASFDWADVDDPSKPVTYELQIASDAAYTTILVDKKGLTTSGYTLADAEKLKSNKKDAPYYWHERAVDAAGNAGNWTGNGTFYVGFSLPEITGVLLYVVLGVVALVFFIIGLMLGRKSSSSNF